MLESRWPLWPHVGGGWEAKDGFAPPSAIAFYDLVAEGKEKVSVIRLVPEGPKGDYYFCRVCGKSRLAWKDQQGLLTLGGAFYDEDRDVFRCGAVCSQICLHYSDRHSKAPADRRALVIRIRDHHWSELTWGGEAQ